MKQDAPCLQASSQKGRELLSGCGTSIVHAGSTAFSLLTDETTEAQRGQVTFPQSLSPFAIELCEFFLHFRR